MTLERVQSLSKLDLFKIARLFRKWEIVRKEDLCVLKQTYKGDSRKPTLILFRDFAQSLLNLGHPAYLPATHTEMAKVKKDEIEYRVPREHQWLFKTGFTLSWIESQRAGELPVFWSSEPDPINATQLYRNSLRKGATQEAAFKEASKNFAETVPSNLVGHFHVQTKHENTAEEAFDAADERDLFQPTLVVTDGKDGALSTQSDLHLRDISPEGTGFNEPIKALLPAPLSNEELIDQLDYQPDRWVIWAPNSPRPTKGSSITLGFSRECNPKNKKSKRDRPDQSLPPSEMVIGTQMFSSLSRLLCSVEDLKSESSEIQRVLCSFRISERIMHWIPLGKLTKQEDLEKSLISKGFRKDDLPLRITTEEALHLDEEYLLLPITPALKELVNRDTVRELLYKIYPFIMLEHDIYFHGPSKNMNANQRTQTMATAYENAKSEIAAKGTKHFDNRTSADQASLDLEKAGHFVNRKSHRAQSKSETQNDDMASRYPDEEDESQNASLAIPANTIKSAAHRMKEKKTRKDKSAK